MGIIDAMVQRAKCPCARRENVLMGIPIAMDGQPLKGMRVYTCTPVAFHGDARFFTRDSGLICKNLRKTGAESMAIMPLPYYEGDIGEDIIRMPMEQLKSADWWRSLKLDGLMLYSWGAPRYTAIARAVKKAGIRLVIHLDTNGDFFQKAASRHRSLAVCLKETITHRLVNILRARHLSYADVITCAEPVGEAILQMPFYAGLKGKFFPFACPVSPAMAYDGRTKEDKIIAIGRWDDVYQKRPEMLMGTLDVLYGSGCGAITEIYGNITDDLRAWHASLSPETQSKVHLAGLVPNHLLYDVYNSSKVLLCPSLFESSHIVSAEMLCCGGSVVCACQPVRLRDVVWYTTRNSGTVAREDTPESLAEAVLAELHEWQSAQRNPAAIAQAWQPFFHADKVMARIFALSQMADSHQVGPLSSIS